MGFADRFEGNADVVEYNDPVRIPMTASPLGDDSTDKQETPSTMAPSSSTRTGCRTPTSQVTASRINASEDRSFVDVDNVAAARPAVQHLVDRGCTRIAMIGGPDDMLSTQDRLAGFTEVTRSSSTAGPVVFGDYGYDSGREAAQQLFADGERIVWATNAIDGCGRPG